MGSTFAGLPPAEVQALPAHLWDRAADGWNHHRALIRRWLSEPTAAMLDAAHIEAGARVLDVAAGAGDQTADIARRVGRAGRVLATDISPRILALAQANLQAGGHTQVELRVADAQQLGLAGAGFDAAVSRLGLMFCRDPLAAFAGVRAALRRGGRFSGLVFSQPQHNPCLMLMMRTALRHAGLPPPAPFEPGTLMSLGEPGRLAQLLGEAGFADVDVQAIAAPFCVATSRAYVDFVRTSGSPLMALLAPLPPAAQHAAWDDMATQLTRFDAPGGWVGPNELLLFSATASQSTAEAG